VTARTKNFLADNTSVFRQAGPDGRFNPGAIVQLCAHIRNTAANLDGCALFKSQVVITFHFVTMLQADKRAEIGAGILRAAQLQFGYFFFHTRQKLIKNRTLYINALGAQADLAAVNKR